MEKVTLMIIEEARLKNIVEGRCSACQMYFAIQNSAEPLKQLHSSFEGHVKDRHAG